MEVNKLCDLHKNRQKQLEKSYPLALIQMSFVQRLKTASNNIMVEHLPHNPNLTNLTMHKNKGRKNKALSPK
jgi:hypothetical protein